MEPDRLFVVSAHRKLLTEIVDSLMRGTQFLALTGASGLGKTTMATAIYEELNKRSMLVGRVDDRCGAGIRLRTIMSQFLGKPEAEIDADDVERLFNAMTGQGPSHEKLVLIIDDAERLQPDAIAYLRLLVRIAPACMPQIVFIGGPSFLEIADQLTEHGFEDLTTARFVLEPLTSTQISVPAEQLNPTPCDALTPGLGSEAATPDSNLSLGRATVAATQLESGGTSLPVTDGMAVGAELDIKVPPHDVRTLPELVIRHQSRSVARIASAVVLISTIGAAAYWLVPLGIDRSSPARRTAAWHQDITQATLPASPDATIQVRLPFSTFALRAQSDVLNFNSASESSAITFVPMSGNPSALATSQIRPRAHPAPAGVEMVLSRKFPGAYVSPATTGTWLFPPNANGGG